jgi:hypothetical protein
LDACGLVEAAMVYLPIAWIFAFQKLPALTTSFACETACLNAKGACNSHKKLAEDQCPYRRGCTDGLERISPAQTASDATS